MARYLTPHHLAVARLIRGLYEDGATLTELEEMSGMTRNTVRAYVTALRKLKIVHITGWNEARGGNLLPTAPEYMMGRSKDAPRPTKSHTDAARDWKRSVKNRALQKQILTALGATNEQA